MDENDKYIRDLEATLAVEKKKVRDAVAARQFSSDTTGKVLLDIVDKEISLLLNKMAKKNPLSDREYLSAHGGIMALKEIRLTLKGKENDYERAKQQSEAAETQLKQVKG